MAPAVAAGRLLLTWYLEQGRHSLPWRHTRDRWEVLVAEVMLQQTQVARVLPAWEAFLGVFPDPATAAAAGPAAVIEQWGRLGYPRRARRLWEAASVIDREGWPIDLTGLPGVGRYTAGAVAAEADGADTVAVDVNIRRVVERVAGRLLTASEAEQQSIAVAEPLTGRDRLLALIDLGAVVCRPRDPACGACPLAPSCTTRGVLSGERRVRTARYEGSMRQRRGRVLARLREGPERAGALDRDAVTSLVADRLAEIDGDLVRLATG